MDFYKALHSKDSALKAIGKLHYGIEYLKDALREHKGLLEALENDNALDVAIGEKRAGSSLSSAMRFLEDYRKLSAESNNVLLRGAITLAHIAKGECGEPNRCALALGLAEMFDVSPDRVVVDGTGAAIKNYLGYEAVSMELSQRLQAWVLAFDADKTVAPIQIVAKPAPDGACDYILDLV